MKLITCASYYGSGSSAITDLISEYNTVFSLSDYEFRFVQDPDGISDLEHNLIENHNRHNSGHALKRFMRLSRFNSGTWFNARYEPFFQGRYLELTEQYFEALCDFSYSGFWFYDLYDKGRTYYYAKQLLSKVLNALSRHKYISVMPKERTYCSAPDEQKFLSCTRQYIHNLFQAANKDNHPLVMVDQLVPPSNLKRYMRYFDDLFVFVVDRDPRDIYTLAKYHWKSSIVPIDDVAQFCEWFLYTRIGAEDGSTDPTRIVRIQFEDLLYSYEDEVSKIEKLVGLSDAEHVDKYKKLNPMVSVNNTQTWRHLNIDQEIAVIEEKLAQYLYPFDLKKNNVVQGIAAVRKDIF